MSISEQDATRLIEKGHILEAENRFDEAMQCYLGAIRLAPNLARAHLNHGNVLLLKGDLPSALDAFRTAIKYKPDYAGAYYNIGNALMNNGHLNDAVVNYRLALEIKPDYAEVLCSLGIAFKDLGKLDDAVANLESALEINPDLVEAHINLGNVKQALMQFEGAVTCYRQAIEVDTDLPELHNNLGLALNNLGEIESALGSFRQALKINPDYAEPYSNMLFTLHYVVTHKPSYYFEQALQYGRLITSKVGMRFSDWQCAIWPERLRVGLLSGDLRNHVVGHFLEGTLAHVNPARIELIAYPTNRQEDELTARIRPCFSEWKPLFGKDDEAAARLIHADRVHILLDISGHTAHTRLPVFAWKPAPVQATWLGYFATTGVAEMDYLLADEVGVPQASQEQFTESVWYLPDTRLCFTAPQIDLPTAILPALLNGHITFGCFQKFAKLENGVLEVWGKIFAALPNANLRLQCIQLDGAAQREQLLQRFQRYGIDPARIQLYGATSREDYLAAHANVDIILDTFPYPGGTTTCEALWMGVPTLTLAGDSLLARQGASLLTAAGLKEWVATSKEEYCAKAITLASDLSMLSALRTGLRQQVMASPLFDAPRFARNLEAALWGMWQKYQAQHGK